MLLVEILLLLKVELMKINDVIIINKINSKRNIAKTKSNKQ